MNLYDEYISEIENTILNTLPHCAGALEFIPSMLSYSLEGGGKRIRPLLTLLFCEAAGGDRQNALLSAVSVEYVHTYSLIHDDLPAMDNDDYRRGKPSAHKKFGEANAILAGDALLTHAFYLLTQAVTEGKLTPAQCVTSVAQLSRLAGVNGMVGGQYLDIACENQKTDLETLFTMDALKTAALIEAACVLGLLAADAASDMFAAAREFSLYLGLAFQITDDLLEYTGDGVSTDEKNNKSTYITECGFEKARDYAESYTQKAVDALTVFGDKADGIRRLALQLLSRNK